MKPPYKELVEKLQELTNILGDQNQDDNYDEIIGHVVTEAQDLLDRAKESQPVLVITVRDGVVNEAKLFDNVHRAEECFTLECLDKGASKDDIEAHIEDGYYQGMNFAVCLVHPERYSVDDISTVIDDDCMEEALRAIKSSITIAQKEGKSSVVRFPLNITEFIEITIKKIGKN